MSLLREIQSSLMSDQPIGPILLKLRFLASRLGSDLLEEWVKHESEGYPPGVELPAYRKIGIAYLGHFSGPFGSGVRNAPIPSVVIQQHAGKEWTSFSLKEGVAAIDDLISSARDSGTLTISADNLIFFLQGKIYEDYACNSVKGVITVASLVGIQNIVRARVLELTIQIEKTIPDSAQITLASATSAPLGKDTAAVTQITNQIIHGNYTAISNSGAGAQFTLNIVAGNVAAVARELNAAGISKADADDLASIFASEKPEGSEEPFGRKAKAWIAKNLIKATNGTWRVGVAVATQLFIEAAKKYYGL